MAPIVGAGLLTSAVAAFATNRPFVTAEASGETAQFVQERASAQAPLAFSLALVMLACWGVVLVSRTRTRQVVLALGTLAGAGATVAAVLARGDASAALTRDYAEVGASAETATTIWCYLAIVTCAAAALVCGYALSRVGAWPQMGARYDAPSSGQTENPAQTPGLGSDASTSPTGPHDLWKSLDRGEDPTQHQ